MVIWITGLSGAGKTTLSEALWTQLKPVLPELASLDGDMVRRVFNCDLGYRESDRVKQIQRIRSIAIMLDTQGFIVLVAALYANEELLRWNRKNFKEYVEVYIDAPLWLVKQRDPKGLYAKAEAGKMKDIVGLDIPWHVPSEPDFRVDATITQTPKTTAINLIKEIPRLAALLPNLTS